MRCTEIILFSITVASCVADASFRHRLENNFGSERFKSTNDGRKDALQTLLEVFGLTAPAQVISNATPPQYMLDLYNDLAYANGVTRKPNQHRAKIIRSFGAIPAHLPSRLVFNLTGTEEDEQVLQSELHIFKRGRSRKNAKVICKVSVYQILDDELDVPSNLKLLATHYALSWTSEWLTFQVKTAVVEWTKNKKSNKGFLVKAMNLNRDKSLQLNLRVDCLENHDNKPLLVVFSNARKQRSFIKKASIPTSHSVDNALAENTAGKYKRSLDASLDEECFRYDMYVDFSEIGWSSWIISPKGYNAHSCRGNCRFPLSLAQRPTNHATVQSIVHELGLHENVSVPCCVPSNLLSISLLYFDDHGNVVIKQYDDMVAEQCGCQ